MISKTTKAIDEFIICESFAITSVINIINKLAPYVEMKALKSASNEALFYEAFPPDQREKCTRRSKTRSIKVKEKT